MHQSNGTPPQLSILNHPPQIQQGPDLLHNLVRSSSDALAIDFLEHGTKRRKFSYKTLHALSDALASKITKRLAKLESASPIIPVFLPQCPELYLVLLAVLKAGKAFCPLSPDTPVERLRFIIEDVSADFVITLSSFIERIRTASDIPTVLVDHELTERGDELNIQLPRTRSDDLAYVLYTSGSTGLPKAVSVSHRAVTQSLLGHDRHLPQFSRFLQFAAPTFDVSIFEIFFPWFRGRTLVGCTRAQMLDDLSGTIRKLEADAAELTPTVVSNLLHGRSSVPGLRLLLTIGEMLNRHVVDEYGGSDGSKSMLWAMYGPTEAAIHCTLQVNCASSASTGTIGSPMGAVSTFIISPASADNVPAIIEILPIGEVGELALGGPQIAEEYLNRPELTSASFIQHPDYGRLYRTGDRARQHENGTLECLGRVVAGQIKLRGQRVELGEVEQIISKIDSCRATVVMVIDDNLVAFCATSTSRVLRSDVIQICKEWLPVFMVPSDVYFLDNMPQLPSGKIDRESLKARYLLATQSNGNSFVDANDEVGQSVLRVFQQHLTRNLTLGTNLAAVGLDSLQSIRIASALRQEGYGLGAMDVLSAETLEELVKTYKDRSVLNGHPTLSDSVESALSQADLKQYQLSRDDIFGCTPCTPLQEAMLAETVARPSAYCNWIEIELLSSYTHKQIIAALQNLVDSNEILRTGFCPASRNAETFTQIIWKNLLPSQIRTVEQFSRAFTLADTEALLRPLNIQISRTSGRPRLLFQIHHALYDGWSMDLMLYDLHKILRGEVIAPRPQFRDISQYLTRDLQRDDREDAHEYWTKFLLEYVPMVLPNFNGKAVLYKGTQIWSGRSVVDHRLLYERAQKLAINPQVFFQAATAYVLSLYSGSTDVVIGNVTSGRTIPVTRVEEIIGPCITSLPFRLNFKDHTLVRDVLHQTQLVNRESLRHCVLPMRDIAKLAKVQPGARLFDLLFVWQQSLQPTSALDAKIIESADDLEFQVTLEYEPRKDYVSFRATFDSSTIPEHQIKYLSRQIDEVVLLFLKDVNCKVTDIVKGFTNGTLSVANPKPDEPRIRQGPSYAVERWASEDPNRLAIVFGHLLDGAMIIKDSMTYGTLNSRANQLARVLAQHGIGQDQLIGVIMEKSVKLYVSILAILKLGCGYLPLVPETPLERIKTIMDDAQVKICISETSVSARLRGDLSIRILESDVIELQDYCDGNLDRPYYGHHLAYAVFTSGSTGTPKGVLVTQNNLMSNLEYLSTIYPYSVNSRLLQSCSQAFDVSVFEIFFSWHVGICLCTARKDDLFYDFEAAINSLQITHLSLTPTVAALVQPKNVPKVEFIVTAGEAVTEIVRRNWAGRGLYQGYGPSETTNICTVRPSVTQTDLINNIGPPFPNTSLFVLDPSSKAILPRGAVGELCFGGAQVFRGYLNRPELNAEKLINLPPYGRIYRSGDMGLLLPDDAILFTGRSDDQVKIRGQRVELGEITSSVLDGPGVRDCVTLLLRQITGTSTLVNFWVPAQSQSDRFECLEPKEHRQTILELFTSLSRRLPSYMIPSHLVPISRLPMTAQAKVDKRSLEVMFKSLTEDVLDSTSQQHEAHTDSKVSTEWEQSIAHILAQILGFSHDKCRPESSFFNMGLDSVSAIRFCTQIRREGLGNFSVSEVLKNPTLAQLTAMRARQHPDTSVAEAIQADLTTVFDQNLVRHVQSQYDQQGLQVARILPCTPLQEAMLSSAQSASSTAYCNVTILGVKGDMSRLRKCWEHMVRRHEILRTSFVSIDDPSIAFAQVILKSHDLQWVCQDFSSDLQLRTSQSLSDLLNANKPPVYVALVHAESSAKLLFCCHHALYDGIAIANLFREIEESYHGSTLPPPIKFDNYLQQMLAQNLSKADEYWTTLFENFEPTYFPTLTGQTSLHGRSTSVSRSLNIPLSVVLEACRNTSVSLLSAVHATWAKLLHFYTGENDLCFGNIVSGRTLPGDDFNCLVAPCFNTLPVRVNFDFAKRNSALLELTHALNIDMLAFQLTPLRRVQNLALRGGGRLFDTLVILQQPTSLLDQSIWSLDQDLGDMDLPVVCEVVQDLTEDVLKLVLHYHTSLLAERDATVIIETFEDSLSTLLNSPEASANDTVALPIHLQAKSNMDWRAFQLDTHFLHSGFERIAANQPDSIALDFLHPDGTRTVWTYQAMNDRANELAYTLIGNGVKPEDIIPLHMSKSPQYYASMLGVLKAGAAFAPVHPDLPDARKQFMFAELQPKLVLCLQSSVPHESCTEALVLIVSLNECCPTSNPVIEGLTKSNLAYCLFTSGSTGVPKAVSMEHRAPIQTIESSRCLIPWNVSSKLLQYAAVTFDMCYYDCFLAWTYGFTLCAAEQHELLNALPDVINKLETDLLDLTPSVAMSLRRSEVPCVKWLYCIGEAMSLDVQREWDGACVNSYGPTEAAFCTTICSLSSDMKTNIIGRPFPTTSFAIFTPKGELPLPLLSVGELYIGGAQLARGYLGKCDLTKERFVMKRNERFYRSGDMVRLLTNGNFEFIGRADDQVKIRGLRVELGEINSILRNALASVKVVVTQILKKGPKAKEQLVAFIVPHQPVDETKRDDMRRKLRQAATEHLPAYMVPQFIVFVEKIPKSMAGKIDKMALTEIFRCLEKDNHLPDGTTKVPPHHWAELELEVRDILARLSHSSPNELLPGTTIYQLGLDSISAVQVAAVLRKQGHSIQASDVMKHMTCTGIAAYLQRSCAHQVTDIQVDFVAFENKYKSRVLEAYDVAHEKVAAVRPCTPLQKGMISQFLSRQGAAYFNYMRLQLGCDVDMCKLKNAWDITMKRHQILRTGFAHLQDYVNPFVMMQYEHTAISLPWTAVRHDNFVEAANSWLETVRRKAVTMLHLPPWELRFVQQGQDSYLDIAMFHGLFDARSLQIILGDVEAVYNSKPQKLPTSLDIAISNIISSSEQAGKDRDRFWVQLGRDTIPSRFPNLAPLRYEPIASRVCTKQSKRPLSQMESACRDANITVQAAGIASWMSVLSAYTGEPSVTCGIVLSGRNFEAAESIAFPCINTVPFCCKVTESRKDMLQQVMAMNANLHQHQATPLVEIQKLMGYPNEALFDTLFAYQKLSDGAHDDLWRFVDEQATVEYPVSIELEPKSGHLECRLTYLPHMIPDEQAKLILEQFDHSLDNFVFSQETSRIDSSSAAVLYSITPARTTALPSKALLLHELFELTAIRHPERIAFEFAQSICDGKYTGRSWTYSELDAEGNRIANLLIARGVLPGGLVGVCFDKCPEASFAMLGILKAGCAFVAIDPGAPAARQAFIAQDAQVAAILSMAPQSAKFKDDVDMMILNLDENVSHSLPTTKPQLAREIDPQERSYCLYTSGTTGTPKGCELTHENAVQALLSFSHLFAGHWDAKSRWLQFASYHFDVSVLEQYWSWSVGICVVSASRDLIFEDLSNSIDTLGITHIDLTPSLAQMLHPDDVPSLCKGVFITGGETLKQEILDTWGSKAVIYNGYGPTEATIGCTMYPRVPANGKPSNIGRQFVNVGSYVLYPDSDIPVLRGGVGELCVSGKLVGKGYLNRPDLTKEKFPYLSRFGERVYRTGDLVRILHDDTFDFLGRADDQVKLRGQRLEIGEINSIIKQSMQDISDVATLVLKHPKQQKEQLVAFLALGLNAGAQPEVLLHDARGVETAKEACHKKLPSYMVPTHFIPLTSLPLNVNNKADAKRLRAIYEALSASDLRKLSASSETEDDAWSAEDQKLRRVIMEALHVEEASIAKGTSFFEVGMDSISVIGVARAMKQAGFSKATTSVVMRFPTIQGLSKVLKTNAHAEIDEGSIVAAQQSIQAIQHRHRRTVAQALGIQTSAVEVLAPCTPLQQGMIARSLDSDNGLYFNTFQFLLTDNVDEARLRVAWENVFASMQILRSVFADTEDGFVQAVIKQKFLPWSLHMVAKGESEVEVLSRIKQKWLQVNSAELTQPFEIALVISPTKRLMVVHVFHALYDGISIEIIFKSMWRAYNGQQLENNVPSFYSTLAYGPLRARSGAREFWQIHLADVPTTTFPSLSNKPAESSSIHVTRELHGLSDFHRIRRKLNVTAQAIAQACWLIVLQRHTRATSTMGIVVSGRSIDIDGADGIIGPMFNTIPYHHRSQPSESWASIIRRVHDFNVAAHPHQHTALRDITKWCGRTASQPLFDNLFVYQIGQSEKEWAKNDAWEIMDAEVVADYPMAFEVEQKGDDTFKLTLIAQGNLSNEQTAKQLLADFELNLRQVLDNPQTTLESFMEAQSATINGTAEVELSGGEQSVFVWTDDATKIRKEIAYLAGLPINEIREMTSIFELGLDSIDGIKLSSRLKRQGVNLSVSRIMRSLTIVKMVQNIASNEIVNEPSATKFALKARQGGLANYVKSHVFNIDNIDEVLPLTPLQEAMVAEMVDSDYRRYFNYDVLKLKSVVDVGLLRKAWTAVVEASPILRTSFVEIDDPDLSDPYAQLVHREHHNFWSETKMEDAPNFSEIFEKLRIDAVALRLSEPPFHVMLVETPEQYYLVLAIAHALYDGWSLGLLHSDVQRAYYDQFVPRPGYKQTLDEIVSTSGSDAAGFWQDYLTGALPSTFPRRPHEQDKDVSRVHRRQRKSQLQLAQITSFAKTSNVSLQTLGQTVFAMVLASYTSSLDVVFGSVLSGRGDDETSQLLFPTMNTVALRAILHGTTREMLHYVQDNFLNIKQWQHYPLRKALAAAGANGWFSESLFIYQKSLKEIYVDQEKLYTSVDGCSDVEYPVCVEMESMEDGLFWRCAVKEDVFSAEGANQLLNRLDDVLRYIMDQPDTPVIQVNSDGTSICGLRPFREKTSNAVISGHLNLDGNIESQPYTQTALKIREVLAAVSKTPEDEIAKDTTIFHIGLDSISAIKVSSLLRKQNIVLGVGEMLRAATVDKMAKIVDARKNRDPGEDDSDCRIILDKTMQDLDRTNILERAGVAAGDVDVILPVSAGQLYMLSMWLNTKGANFYPEFTYEISGEVALNAIQSAWKSLVQANPILRTRFIATNDLRTPYVQVVLKTRETTVSDITGNDATQMANLHAKLNKTQPWAYLLVSRNSTPWNVRLKIHHALYDGVSLPLLMHQFRDVILGGVPSLPNHTLSRLVANTHTAFALDSRQAFWTTYLKDLRQQRVPQPSESPTIKTEIFRPCLVQTSPLEALARRQGVSVHSLFLATYARLYARMTHTASQKGVVIGVYLANRSLPIPDIAATAIPTVSLLPLRVNSPLEHSITELAEQIQKDLQEISDPVNVGASLYEISVWTGVKVDTFVNFLTLPDTQNDGVNEEENIKFKSKSEWGDAISRVSPIETVSEDVLDELKHEAVNGAYLHAIDVEATIRNGALDVGVFAPVDMLSLEDGEKLIEDLRRELGDL